MTDRRNIEEPQVVVFNLLVRMGFGHSGPRTLVVVVESWLVYQANKNFWIASGHKVAGPNLIMITGKAIVNDPGQYSLTVGIDAKSEALDMKW